MFYYYGRKKQLAGHYPEPLFGTIIEPFAGAAAYSLWRDNWQKEVILVEKDNRIAKIWKWLIEQATVKEIESMPNLRIGETTSNMLHIVHAATKQASAYKKIKVTEVLARNWEISKRRMAKDLHKIKHWQIIEGNYFNIPDIEATWFVDPPYKGSGGTGYRWGSKQLDYPALGKWIEARQGQIIACEGIFGDYLNFAPLRDCTGVAGKISIEKVYHKITAQQGLFD